MNDMTQKARLEGQRGYVIQTRSWEAIAEFYRNLNSKGEVMAPMLQLIEAPTRSPAGAQLHGATSMDTLLLSDSPDFRSNDSTLRIAYDPSQHVFHFEHQSFSGQNDHKTCAEAEGLATLRLFIRLKYGVLLDTTTA